MTTDDSRRHEQKHARREGAADDTSQRLLDAFPRERLIPMVRGMFTLNWQDWYPAGIDLDALLLEQSHEEVLRVVPRLNWSRRFQSGVIARVEFSPMGPQHLRLINAIMLATNDGYAPHVRSLHRERVGYGHAALPGAQQQLRLTIRPETNVEDGAQVVLLSISMREFARLIGARFAPNSGVTNEIYRALNLLATTRIELALPAQEFRPGGRKMSAVARRFAIESITSSNIISRFHIRDGMIHLAVMPQIVRSSSRMPGTYSMFSLRESFRLRRSPALLLHSYLSGFIPQGGSRTLGYDTLMQRLWLDRDMSDPGVMAIADVSALSPEQRRDRFAAIRRAAAEIQALGWGAELDARKRVAVFTRPGILATPEPGAQIDAPDDAGDGDALLPYRE